MEAQIAEYDSLNYLSEYSRDNVIDGIRTLDSLENGWQRLKNYEVNPNEGFMFSGDPFIHTIAQKMTVGHSGASFADTMRHLHYISKYGLAAHRLKIHWNSNWTTPPGPLEPYSDYRSNKSYEEFIHRLSDRELDIYSRLLSDKLRQVYPREEDADTRAARMKVFDAAVNTRPQSHS